MSFLDLNFIKDNIPLYWQAVKLTFNLGMIGALIALVMGFITSLIVYYKVPVLNKIFNAYIQISRNIPLLILLFFLYFGLSQVGIKLSSVSCAIIGLSFLGGGYMAEAFRSGLESVNKVQIEAGLSLGFNSYQLMKNIIMPQSISISLPAISANIIFLIKETSMFSAIALPDLMMETKDLIGLYYKTNESLLMLVVGYLIILLPTSFVLTFIERKIRYGEFGV